MRSQTVHFIHLFIGSLIFGMGYLYVRFVCVVTVSRWKRLMVSGALFSSVAAVFMFFVLKFKGQAGFAFDLLAWYAYLGLGFLSFLLPLVIMRDVWILAVFMVRRIVRRKKQIAPGMLHPEDRRLFLKQGVSRALAGASMVLSGAGIVQAHTIPGVREVMIPVAHLPEDLSGFSVVQITDIHLGPTLKRSFLEDVVRSVNGLYPDIIALTGDLVDGRVEELKQDVQPLGGLRSRHGNFFVTGNHEYYSNGPAWIDAVNDLGFTTLVNSHRIVAQGEGRVLVAGVPDLKAERFVREHRPDAFAALENAPPVHVKILLAHQPKAVYQAAAAGFDIQISGHTHGGQMFPWNMIVGLNQPYLAGLYTVDGVKLYVSRGTGYWGPPMRLFAPSEITRLILVPAV